LELTIFGNPPSKSNCYQIITIPARPARAGAPARKAHASLGKTKALRAYEKNFQRQLTGAHRLMIECRITVCLRVYYDSERPDLDNCFKVIFDCLQPPKVKAPMPPIKGVIKNDRQVRRIIAERFKDTKNPRVEIEITEYIGPDVQLLFEPTDLEVLAWVGANAPHHIRKAIEQRMET
jgi:Holliday junction resolvase RusA-like endonuclease